MTQSSTEIQHALNYRDPPKIVIDYQTALILDALEVYRAGEAK